MAKRNDAVIVLSEVKKMFEIVHGEIWRSEALLSESLADKDNPNWEDRFKYMSETTCEALNAFESYLSNMYDLERANWLMETRGIKL